MLVLATGVITAFADDTKAPDARPPSPPPKKAHITFEYSYPPPPTEKPPHSAEAAPLPRVGSREWLHRVDSRDRQLLAPWEWRRLNAWRGACSVIEPPPWANIASGTGR